MWAPLHEATDVCVSVRVGLGLGNKPNLVARSSANSSSCLLVSCLSTQATLPTPAAAEVNAVIPLLRKVGMLLYEEGEPAMMRYLDNIISFVKNAVLMASTKTKMRMSGNTPDAILRGDKDGRLLSFLQQTTSKHAEVLDSLVKVQQEMLRQDDVKESRKQLLSLNWAAKFQSLQQDQLFGDLVARRVEEFSAKLDELATGMVKDCRAMQKNQANYWRQDLASNAAWHVVELLASETVLLLDPSVRKLPDTFMEVSQLCLDVSLINV